MENLGSLVLVGAFFFCSFFFGLGGREREGERERERERERVIETSVWLR